MIIVTGGAGFIGSNIVKELNRRGRQDILVVDDLNNKQEENQVYRNLVGLQFIDFINKDDFLYNLVNGGYNNYAFEGIFHNGACSDTMEYDVNYMLRTNYDYSKNLLNFAQNKQIPFIYASSAATYGDGKNGFREGDASEGALNPYAYSKLLFDRYVRQVIKAGTSSQIIGLKYFNVYGEQEHHKGKMASIVYQLYKQLKASGRCQLFRGNGVFPDGGQVGDGEQRRDFIYVQDVVKVNLWFWENAGRSGIYNCGTGESHSFNEMAWGLCEALGWGEVDYIDFPEKLVGKYQNYTQSDNSELYKAGYDRGFWNYKDAIRHYVEFLEAGGYYEYGK